MTSHDCHEWADAELDHVLASTLRESVRGKEPPARVRESLLRAAEASRRRSIRISLPVVGVDDLGAKGLPESASWDHPRAQPRSWGMPTMVWLLEAQFSKLRAIG